MSAKSRIIRVPTLVDPGESFLVDYWSKDIGISRNRLLQACSRVGPRLADIRRHVQNGITVAIRDDHGIERKVTKIVPMTDGFAVSVPYHSAREGWLFKHVIDYQGTFGIAEIADGEHFTAGDRVKLSMHLDGGFVQFSRGGERPIISGRDKDTGNVKGLGLTSRHPIEVKSGPLFGVQVQRLEDFEQLDEPAAEVFTIDDCFIHPRETHAASEAYNIEGFMLPRAWISRATLADGRMDLHRELPFISMFTFPFHIRIIEFPRLKWVIGIVIHRFDRIGEGYCLSGPSCGPPERKIALGAMYPIPEVIRGSENAIPSLDYRPVTNPGLATAAPPGTANMVYVASRGKKYHAAGCSFLTASAIVIPLREAQRTREACKACRPGG